jgi:hypothetical protein
LYIDEIVEWILLNNKIMKVLFAVALFVPLFVLSGCKIFTDPNKFLKETTIGNLTKYELLSQRLTIADQTEIDSMLISREDYERIVSTIKAKKYFEDIVTEESNSGYINSDDFEHEREVAWHFDGVYTYQICKANPARIITIGLVEDSLMTIKCVKK